MRDLSVLLRDHVESLAPPIRYDEVVVARPRRRPPLGLMAAVVLVALGLVAVAVGTRSGDEGDVLATGVGSDVSLVWVGEDGLIRIADASDGEERGGEPLALRCSTCGILRIGETLYAASDTWVYRLDSPQFSPFVIDEGNVVFRSAVADELFVAHASYDAPNGDRIRRITTTGTDLGGPWDIPEGYWLTSPPRATARGIVLETPENSFRKTFVIWDPVTGAMGPLGDGTRLIDTRVEGGATLVARTTQDCRRNDACALAITDVASGGTRIVDPPGNDLGFIGGGAFSPDGTKLAVFSVIRLADLERKARLTIVDVRSGRATAVEDSTIEFGESYGFATWAPDGHSVVFGGLGRPVRIHRLGIRGAVTLDVPANYSMVAVTMPPTLDPTTATASSVPSVGTSTPLSPSRPTHDLADGRHFGFLKGIDETQRALIFDLAEFFSGEAATRAGREDGAIDEGDTASNDYYIRNQNPRLRVLGYSPSVTVTAGSGCERDSTVEVCTYMAYDFPSLLNRLRNPDAPMNGVNEEGLRVWLTVADGVVTHIENPYFP